MASVCGSPRRIPAATQNSHCYSREGESLLFVKTFRSFYIIKSLLAPLLRNPLDDHLSNKDGNLDHHLSEKMAVQKNIINCVPANALGQSYETIKPGTPSLALDHTQLHTHTLTTPTHPPHPPHEIPTTYMTTCLLPFPLLQGRERQLADATLETRLHLSFISPYPEGRARQ